MIIIRRAEKDDIPMIMQFLDDHWLHGYALAQSRELFDWQFVDNDTVNVWIGVDNDTHIMYAMEGAILYNHDKNPDFAATMWIAIKCDVPMLGLRLSEQQIKDLNIRAGYALGLSAESAAIQKRLHKPVFTMGHYYRLNDMSDYRIASISHKDIPEVKDYGYTLSPITTVDQMREAVTPDMLSSYSPRKDYEYVEWRYFRHPIFRYDMWRVNNSSGITVGMLVTRTETANDRYSCKIIDYYGDNSEIGKLGCAFDWLLKDKDYEFIDVYSYGVDVSEYTEAGMLECNEDSENIIPNFFQPYECKNTSIYMIKPLVDDARLFRGDADQDKPRLL